MPKKPIKEKSPVKLRMRKASNGNYSLYLDIYSEGKRKKEYLKLYLLPARTEAAKKTNEKTMELARTIQAERILNLQANKSTFFNVTPKELNLSFADYIANEIKRLESIKTKNYIRRYRCGESWVRKFDSSTTLGQIDKQWVQRFLHFLSITPGSHGRKLNQNTIHEYLIYIANILNNAVREGILAENPTKKLNTSDRPKKYDSKREYLTMDEIKKLESTPSPGGYNNIRCAFLFACFCGLRYSDIQQLQWKDIKQKDGSAIINKKLQKTQTIINLPLNKKAISLLPPRTKDKDLVFILPKSMVTVEAYVKVWAEFTGLEKHVTFHTSRHTFAVNILAHGGDVYTLSKLLGHKKVTTTQIYAEVLDENKKKTIELLDDD